MLLPHMVVKGKVGSIPVQFYCLSLHIKSIEIACGMSDVWAGSMYWLSSKWSEQIWYELYNCFAVFEPRSPGAKTIKKNTNSTQNKSQTHCAKQYEVMSFLSTDC